MNIVFTAWLRFCRETKNPSAHCRAVGEQALHTRLAVTTDRQLPTRADSAEGRPAHNTGEPGCRGRTASSYRRRVRVTEVGGRMV